MTDTGGIAGAQLRAFIERIERLEEEKKTIADDIRDVYAEAKANGFDAPTLRQVVKLRRMDAAARQEREALLDLYMHALGMLAETELGEAAVEAERKRLLDEAEASLAKPQRGRKRKDDPAEIARKAFGDPAPLTDQEKDGGVIAAFVDRDGTRVSIGTGKGKAEAAFDPYDPAGRRASP